MAKERETRYRRFAETWASISTARRPPAAGRSDLTGRALQRAAESSPEARARVLETYREAGAEEGRRVAAALPSSGTPGDPGAILETAALLAGAEIEFVQRGPRRWEFRVRGLPPQDLLAGLQGEVFVEATTAYLRGLLAYLAPGTKASFDLSGRGELTVLLEK